jgi:hypothetical protein
MREDILELTRVGAGNTETVRVTRGTFELHAGCLSYRALDDEERSTRYPSCPA